MNNLTLFFSFRWLVGNNLNYRNSQELNGSTADLFDLNLFDSGSTTTLINKRSVPPSIITLMGNPQAFTTTQGAYESNEYLMTKQLFFPKFCKTRTISSVNVRMFDSPHSWYNIIIGRDILGHGFILDHARNVITWDELLVPMLEASTSASTTATTNFSCPHMALTVYAVASQPILQARYERSLP